MSRLELYLIAVSGETAFATLHQGLFPCSTGVAPVFPVNLSVLRLHSVTQIEDIG